MAFPARNCSKSNKNLLAAKINSIPKFTKQIKFLIIFLLCFLSNIIPFTCQIDRDYTPRWQFNMHLVYPLSTSSLAKKQVSKQQRAKQKINAPIRLIPFIHFELCLCAHFCLVRLRCGTIACQPHKPKYKWIKIKIRELWPPFRTHTHAHKRSRTQMHLIYILYIAKLTIFIHPFVHKHDQPKLNMNTTVRVKNPH